VFDPPTAGSFDVLEFRLAAEWYAIEQAYVLEVRPLKDLTPLPCTRSFILGIVNMRGQILPVIDVKKFFEMPDVGITDLHAVIVVRAGEIDLGVLADAIGGVCPIASNRLQSSSATTTGIRSTYRKAVTDEPVLLLDVPQMLADPKVTIDEHVTV
jgi:purine-binding chemotaxis protein CheW